MTELLELSHLVEEYGVTEVQVRGGGIEPGLTRSIAPVRTFAAISSSTSSSSQPRLMTFNCSTTSTMDFPGGAAFMPQALTGWIGGTRDGWAWSLRTLSSIFC
jgi:hypothetical protein